MKANSQVKKFLAAIGRKGGKSRSAKKLAAIRRNARLGGRPRKPVNL